MSTQDITTAPLEDQMILRIAKLMQGGEEDEDICKTLDAVTRLLNDESVRNTSSKPLHELIDKDGFVTILECLDMRQGNMIRGHAIVTVSSYLKVTDKLGAGRLREFFLARVRKATYDDFIVAFSVAASVFPVVPGLSAELFLSEGFVSSLGPLMKRKWKSRKVEQACLEMLNAACMDTACREAIRKYCAEWLEEIIANHPVDVADIDTTDRHLIAEDGPLQQRIHSQEVRNVAAVILTKIQAVTSSNIAHEGEKVTAATSDMDELSELFQTTLTMDSTEHGKQTAIEGLAFASIKPNIKEKLSSNPAFLRSLLELLRTSPAKSPISYGGLSILNNLTNYLPARSEEEKKMDQLKAYANAQQPSMPLNVLNNDEHVAKRCMATFNAGVIPILVTHSLHGSTASLTLVVSIIFSIAKTSHLRGQMAQQGAVRLLLHAYSNFPETETRSRRHTAHALALILISTNPTHVFGGTNPQALVSAITPLVSLLVDDPTSDSTSLLPVFEALLALTNLASTDDTARNPIIRTAFPLLDDLLLSSNPMVTRATVELLCNLMQSPLCVEKFGEGSKQASNRTHILLALADAEDVKTRMAAGGALASLTEWDTAVNTILERERGTRLILGLCEEDDEGLRHRGVVCVFNMINVPGKVGDWALKKVLEEEGVDALKECLKKSRSQEVLGITVEALKKLLAVKTTQVEETIEVD